jgi:hypothetical protein
MVNNLHQPALYAKGYRLTQSHCVSIETCQNNGTCVNRQGSFSCACPSNSKITGKLCQFTEKVCKNKCQKNETCYPKENQLGYECIANPLTVSMEYPLDSSQRPFQDWMKYDIAQNVENAIVTSGLNEVGFCICLFCSFCSVLFCPVLFCFVLFCFVLFCFVLFVCLFVRLFVRFCLCVCLLIIKLVSLFFVYLFVAIISLWLFAFREKSTVTNAMIFVFICRDHKTSKVRVHSW